MEPMADASPPARSRRASPPLAWWLFAVGFHSLVASFGFRIVSGRPTEVADITQPLGFLAIGGSVS
jgi:hypothetical protein